MSVKLDKPEEFSDEIASDRELWRLRAKSLMQSVDLMVNGIDQYLVDHEPNEHTRAAIDGLDATKRALTRWWRSLK